MGDYKECELCGDIYNCIDDEEQRVNFDSIAETGRCQGCYEEFGNTYPDR
jgi:hypothetical protein